MFTFLDLRVSSLRRGHANPLCIVPSLPLSFSRDEIRPDFKGRGGLNAPAPSKKGGLLGLKCRRFVFTKSLLVQTYCNFQNEFGNVCHVRVSRIRECLSCLSNPPLSKAGQLHRICCLKTSNDTAQAFPGKAPGPSRRCKGGGGSRGRRLKHRSRSKRPRKRTATEAIELSVFLPSPPS